MADLGELLREHVEQEPAEEGDLGEGGGGLALGPEGHQVAGDLEQPGVGDAHPVHRPREVGRDLPGLMARRFGIDVTVLFSEGILEDIDRNVEHYGCILIPAAPIPEVNPFYLRPKVKHSPGGDLRQTMKKANTNPLLAVAYLRVSTDEQTLGMEAQRAAIVGWAQRQGVTVVGWCEDIGVSGGAELEKRPGLLEALGAVRIHRVGLLVAHKADRIARDVYVSELVKRELRAMGASVALVEGICGDDPFSEMAATVMDAAARLERRMIAARTKAALGVKKSKGEKTGGSEPYGFRLINDGIHMEDHPFEYPILLRILQLRKAGLGGRRIATTLTEEGHRPRGKAWNPGNLQVMADRWLGTELPPKMKADLDRGQFTRRQGAFHVTVTQIEVMLPM